MSGQCESLSRVSLEPGLRDSVLNLTKPQSQSRAGSIGFGTHATFLADLKGRGREAGKRVQIADSYLTRETTRADGGRARNGILFPSPLSDLVGSFLKLHQFQPVSCGLAVQKVK